MASFYIISQFYLLLEKFGYRIISVKILQSTSYYINIKYGRNDNVIMLLVLGDQHQISVIESS